MEGVVCAVDEAEGEESDDDLPDGSDEERAKALFAEVSEAGAEADAREGEQEGPAGEVADGQQLRLGEESDRCEQRDQQEAEDELGEFRPEEGGFVLDLRGLALGGPVDGVAKDDEADQGVAAGLGEDGDLAGGVGVERAGRGGLGGVVYGEAGPDAVGMVGEVQRVSDEGEDEERDGSEREDGGDSVGGVLFVGFDGALRGDDGGDSADRTADREQRDELRRELEASAEVGHEGEGKGDLDEDEREGYAAEFGDVSEDEPRSEQDDASLEPELIGGHAATEDCRDANGIGDGEADEDSPEDVLDVGKDQMVGLAVAGDELLDELSAIADGGEQEQTGDEAERVGGGVRRGLDDRLGDRLGACRHGAPFLPGHYFEDAEANEESEAE
jgi:hypothetical protein